MPHLAAPLIVAFGLASTVAFYVAVYRNSPKAAALCLLSTILTWLSLLYLFYEQAHR